jgi:nucleotide-binding universal stress UspA family protein
MTFKNILALLGRGPGTAWPYAMSFASAFEAHLTAAALVDPPLPDIAYAGLPYDIIASAQREARQTAAEALRDAEELARRDGLACSGTLIEADGEPLDEALAKAARSFDVTIVGQPGPESHGEERSVLNAALFRSGRPVLWVPYIQRAPATFDTVLVAWDASQVAARAIGDAMPILAKAVKVEVVSVGPRPADPDQAPEVDIMRHLARHGIVASFERIDTSGDVADALLSHSFDITANVLVMGAYGHSKLRENLFGGATRGIIEAMTLPVFTSH